MATLVAQTFSESGNNDITFETCNGGGDEVLNNGQIFIWMKNASLANKTLTITAQDTSVATTRFGQLTKSNATIVIESESEGLIGPFAQAAYNDADGMIQLTYSAVTDCTIAIMYYTL